MNAVFAPDSRRHEVTWIGTLCAVAKKLTNNSVASKLKFVARPRKIYIGNKVTLNPKDIEKIVVKNGRVSISQSEPTIGFKYPLGLVVLVDSGLKFTVRFMNEHLDMFWHSTALQRSDSHGLIG